MKVPKNSLSCNRFVFLVRDVCLRKRVFRKFHLIIPWFFRRAVRVLALGASRAQAKPALESDILASDSFVQNWGFYAQIQLASTLGKSENHNPGSAAQRGMECPEFTTRNGRIEHFDFERVFRYHYAPVINKSNQIEPLSSFFDNFLPSKFFSGDFIIPDFVHTLCYRTSCSTIPKEC